jgi:hypothetical protein
MKAKQDIEQMSADSLPSPSVLLRAAQLSMTEDKPLYFDYYRESVEKKCCIGVKDTTKYLVKSDDEYTSTIQSVFRCENCFIVMTENSLYIVSSDIPVKKIVSSSTD